MPETSKSIFLSARFWVNVAGLALELANAYVQVVPGGAVGTAVAVGNIAMRRYKPDSGEVHVVTPREAKE